MPGGVWLIANPQAGRKVGLTTNPTGPDDALAALRRAYPAAELHLTERAGHATELAREAVRASAELVVAAGGDGTVREVACGLIGTGVALAILPLGSMLDLARSLGVPRTLDGAVEVIRRGHLVAMDVGRATTPTANAFFLEAAGVGFDAAMFVYSNAIDAGNWRALKPLLHYLARAHSRTARLTVDGQSHTVRAFMITVGITPFTGAAVAVAPEALLDDGQFDVVVRGGESRLELLRHALSMLLLRRSYRPRTITLRGSHVLVQHRGRKLLVHADGVSLRTTPARCELLPGALRVLAGETAATVAKPAAQAAAVGC